jgi:hypothetical protein
VQAVGRRISLGDLRDLLADTSPTGTVSRQRADQITVDELMAFLAQAEEAGEGYMYDPNHGPIVWEGYMEMIDVLREFLGFPPDGPGWTPPEDRDEPVATPVHRMRLPRPRRPRR